MNPALWRCVAPLLMVCVWGCGGGGGGGGSTGTTAPQAPPSPSNPPPTGPSPSTVPDISFSAADAVVSRGSGTTLTWTSRNSTSCTASGDWSGAKGTAGTQTVGPLQAQATYTLTCVNGRENAVAMLAVDVRSPVTIEWRPPTENVDGSSLEDLAGFRIYQGSVSREYDDFLQVTDPAATRQDVLLRSGRHFISMTAFDTEGNESILSNEVVRDTP